MIDAITKISQMTVRFGRKPALDKIDLSLRPGESVLVAGRNGAGKSTFLKCLAGVIIPDSGRIEFAPGLDRRRRIKRLSAGERVLYHLGLLTAQKPDLLLVDEIIHTIDPYMRSRFLDALIDLMADYRTTVILVNHAFSEVERIPERILLLDGGRFVLDESAESLRARIKRVVSAAEIPAQLPVIFRRGPEQRRMHYIHPFQERFREQFSLAFEDLDLEEIMKALIGGRYAQERNS